ncbi:hypothetical protein CBL_01015 [Carabus blaptoides fortunei]
MKVFVVLLVCFGANLVYCDVVMTVPNQNNPLHLISKKFLSVALDTAVIADNFEGFNMSNPRFLKMVTHLSPGYLRIGGNMADRLYFVVTAEHDRNNAGYKTALDGGECAYEELAKCDMNFPNFTMTAHQWTQLNEFARRVHTKILFDLNCLTRNTDGSWNADNARELITYSHRKAYDIDWQLGNEPDAFKHVFNIAVNASQLAKDFATLRTLLNTFPRYKNSLLVGPDTTRPRPEHRTSAKYLEQFLQASDKDVLDAVTFHQYYLNGHIAQLADFLNLSTFQLLEDQLTLANQLVSDSPLRGAAIWLTETASAYGNGAPGLSDSFVASFLWLDKLGLAARHGLYTVVRQSLVRGYYALITDDYQPTPDYWLSIVFNMLVGPEVIACHLTPPAGVRLYCHCAKQSWGKITVFGINVMNATVPIHVNSTSVVETGDQYILTAQGNNLTTKNVLLNDVLLQLTDQGELPVFPKKRVDLSQPLWMPAQALAFWVIPTTSVAVCSPVSVTQV